MTLDQLIYRLEEIKKKGATGMTMIDVMIETDQPEKCQYQFPANDVAYSRRTATIIIMHEKWNGQ